MSKGYFYFHNNRPVIAAERKPEVADKAKRSNLSISEHTQYMDWLMRALKEWERQLIPAENVELWNDEDPDSIARIDLPINPDNILIIYPGSKIEYEGNVITKIL